MKVKSHTSVGQQAVEFLVSCCEVQAWSCLEGFSVDGLWVKVVSDEDILITPAWSDWEPPCLICIKFSGQINCLFKNKIGVLRMCGLRELVLLWIWVWVHDLVLCGSEALPWLLEVPKYCRLFFLRFFWTRSTDRPDQEVKNFLVIAFPHLEWVGLYQDAWW